MMDSLLQLHKLTLSRHLGINLNGFQCRFIITIQDSENQTADVLKCLSIYSSGTNGEMHAFFISEPSFLNLRLTAGNGRALSLVSI